MRSLALLRGKWKVGGKDFWKSVHAASRWCFGRHVLEHWYVYLRSCRFGISLICQFAGVSPENTWVVLPCLVLSLLLLLLLLLLVLLVLLLLLLLLAFPLPSCLRHKGHTQRSSLAGRSGWQQPCVLEANGQRSPCRAWEQGDALMRLLGTCPNMHDRVCTLAVSLGLRRCLAREACLFVWAASALAPVSLVGRFTL